MFIRTQRLFLRPGWSEDLTELLELINDESVLLNLAVEPMPATEEEIRKFLARPRDPLLPHFFINLRTPNGPKLIGGIGLGRDGDDVELGYWISKYHWGQGYATEALEAVLDHAHTLGHKRIVATHFADNPASARILHKAGFRTTGETRQCFSVGRGAEAPAVTFAVDLDPVGSASASTMLAD